MKLLLTALAGVSLIALAGCNRTAATNNAAGNAATNVSNAAAPADNSTAGKPADGGGEAEAPAEDGNSAGADGGKPVDGSEDAADAPPADGEGGK